MVNYQNGKIYKLVNNLNNKIYVGSTCNPLSKRKGHHRNDCKKKDRAQVPVYKHINMIGWENIEIILIENFPCNEKNELHKRERYYIDLLKPELNKVIPARTQQEYKALNKKYRYDNKEQIKQKKKILMTCECGTTLRREDITRHQRSKKHLYFIKNGVNQEKNGYECVCGSILQGKDISRHNKTLKHLNFISISISDKEINHLCICGAVVKNENSSRHKRTQKHLFYLEFYNYIIS